MTCTALVATSRDFLQSHHLLILLIHGNQSFVDQIDVGLKSSNSFKFFQDAVDDHAWQQLTGFDQLRWNAGQQHLVPFWQGNAKLVKQATQGIGLHDTHLHELGAHTVQTKAGLLLDTFKRDCRNMELLSGSPDPLGIASIGFVPQYKWPHLLGWQQFNLVTLRLLYSTPVVGTAAGFHRDQSGLPVYKEIRFG